MTAGLQFDKCVNSVDKHTLFEVLEEDYLGFFSTGELTGREFEGSVDCCHLCRNSTEELAGWAVLHFSLFAGSCYSHIMFCVSELLVIGVRGAEVPTQLILSFQLSLTSSEKHTHCCHKRTELVKIFFSSPIHTPLAVSEEGQHIKVFFTVYCL